MCIIALKSMTYAFKAKKALDDSLIESEIIKLEPQMTKKGCAYGISFNCINLENVQCALKKFSIRYSEIVRM